MLIGRRTRRLRKFGLHVFAPLLFLVDAHPKSAPFPTQRLLDILHYNVGMSIVGGDAPLDEITEHADRSADEALAEVWAACFCAFTFPRGCTPEVGSFSDPKVVGHPPLQCRYEYRWRGRAA